MLAIHIYIADFSFPIRRYRKPNPPARRQSVLTNLTIIIVTRRRLQTEELEASECRQKTALLSLNPCGGITHSAIS